MLVNSQIKLFHGNAQTSFCIPLFIILYLFLTQSKVYLETFPSFLIIHSLFTLTTSFISNLPKHRINFIIQKSMQKSHLQPNSNQRTDLQPQNINHQPKPQTQGNHVQSKYTLKNKQYSSKHNQFPYPSKNKHNYLQKIKSITDDQPILSVLKAKEFLQDNKKDSSSPQNYNQNNYFQDNSEMYSASNLGQSYLNQNKPPYWADKKERNKISAKQSRERKKLYVQMLEEKSKTLNKKLLSKKKELQQTKDYLDRVMSQNKIMSGFTASRHLMIKQLQKVLSNQQLSPQERDRQIKRIIEKLRYKIGATGKERLNTINEYFRQIINLSLPALHRYMMWSASEQKHLFAENDEDQQNDWYKQLKIVLELNEEQKRQILSKKPFLQQQKTLLENMVEELKQVKNLIEDKSIQLEDLIDSVRDILSPVQCAKFILFIQKNKYRKELNLCQNFKVPQKPINSEGQLKKSNLQDPRTNQLNLADQEKSQKSQSKGNPRKMLKKE